MLLLTNLLQAAYTFDAGPNACLFLLKKDVPEFLHLVKYFFPPTTEDNDFIKGMTQQLADGLSKV